MQCHSNYAIELEKRLSALLIGESVLMQAARYATLDGGKRIRPHLLFAVASDFGNNIDACVDAACALEMVHTYSLIHDDLPCMDNDDMRRGKPSLHKAYPEGVAVLVGDELLTYAFELLTTISASDAQKIALIQTLAKAAGRSGMIGGQAKDLLSTGSTVSTDELFEIYRGKTSALLSASLVMGAILADAPLKDQQLLCNVGDKVGLAYQIYDDVLDITGSEEEMGKPVGSDAGNAKATYALRVGPEQAMAYTRNLHAGAHAMLSQISQPLPTVVELIDQLLIRRS